MNPNPTANDHSFEFYTAVDITTFLNHPVNITTSDLSTLQLRTAYIKFKILWRAGNGLEEIEMVDYMDHYQTYLTVT